jgi:hypothetical protein
MTGEWMVTWQRATFAPIGAQNIPAAHAQRACDSQREAVIFAMNLDDAQRRTARFRSPRGEIVELPVIEQMWATPRPSVVHRERSLQGLDRRKSGCTPRNSRHLCWCISLDDPRCRRTVADTRAWLRFRSALCLMGGA